MTNKHLYIITPVSRPENIPTIRESILPLFKQFVVQWMKTETPRNDRFGNCKRNLMLGMVPRFRHVWVYFLDDDNIIHPDFPRLADEATEKVSDDLILFRQEEGGKIRELVDPPQIVNGHIDTAQMLVRASAIKKARWSPDVYEADYYFAAALLKDGARLKVVNQVAAYYNQLRK